MAQHSVLVERVALVIEPGLPRADRLAALLHDSPEYVIGDLISPFKAVLGDAYKAIEHRLLAAIHRRFDVPDPSPVLSALIKRADQIAAYGEATELAGFQVNEAALYFGRPPPEVAVALGPLVPQRSPEAEAAFLARFEALQRDAN